MVRLTKQEERVRRTCAAFACLVHANVSLVTPLSAFPSHFLCLHGCAFGSSNQGESGGAIFKGVEGDKVAGDKE